MKTWLISDTHFMHDKVYKFTDANGNLIRTFASNAKEGDEYMIDMWNQHVAPNDKVYHLGDVSMPRKGLDLLSKCNGRKILIRGNHDIFDLKDYSKHFKDVRGSHKLGELLLTHYPIHRGSIAYWMKGNIHGHTHGNNVPLEDDTDDPLYENVCVEKTNGKPIDFEEVRVRILARQ